MDRRIQILAGSVLLLGLIVAVVVIAGGGEDPAGDETVAGSGEKPQIEVPEGPPPRQLQTEDIEVGDGPEAQEGDTVTVDYVGVLYEDGEEFDSSYDAGEPVEFPLESGSLIEGWVRGMEGMRVGGRRQLIIPPRLAYGEQGSPPAIPPDATLIFDVELLGVE